MFPGQRIQTDRGTEFFAYAEQKRLMEYNVKFRPIRPGAPHLDGMVERSQKTDKIEFYALQDLDDPELDDRLAEWQLRYNWHRPHATLGGKTPLVAACRRFDSTPFWHDVYAHYDPTNERLKERNYQLGLRLRKLKECP